MEKTASTPTMKDVAAAAGVSLGTVSKVVNGLPVGREYQKKVETAIEQLGYRVNSYAQGMKAGRTYTVAFLVPNTLNPFFGALTYYINQSLAARGYRMLLCTTDADVETEQAYFDMAQRNQVDGIISISYNERPQIRKGTQRGRLCPVVTIDRHFSPDIPCVTSDNYGGGQLAAEKLEALGCQHVAFLGTGSPLPNEASKRKDGFRNACETMGLPCEVLSVVDGTPFAVFEDFLTAHTHAGKLEFDGIFCITDHLAERVIQVLRRMGQSVPETVQVIGFDGIRRFSTGEYLCSTIVQSPEKLAELSVDLVLNDNRPPSLICAPVTYAAGGTTREVRP